MFDVRTVVTRLRRTAPSRVRTKPRTILRCEQLADRINPTTTGKFFSDYGGTHGTFTYDESAVDGSQATQSLTLNNFNFDVNINGSEVHYVADTDPVVQLSYGVINTGTIQASPQSIPDPDLHCPHLTISYTNVVWDTQSGTAGVAEDNNPAQSYDSRLMLAPMATLDFANITTGFQPKYFLTVVFWDDDGNNTQEVIEVGPNMTAAQIRDAVYTQALAANFIATKSGSSVTITGTTKIEFFAQTSITTGQYVPNFQPMTMTGRAGGCRVFCNESELGT